MADEGQRLSKVVAAQVPCSRREAEQYITEGRVRVDGRVVEQPQFRVADGQRVEVESRERLQPVQPVTFLVHKPAGMRGGDVQGLLADASHWSGDTSGIRRVKSHLAGLTALLPLPTPASGLTVLSQDRGVIRKLTQDAAFVEREFVVEVTGAMANHGLEKLGRGMVTDDGVLPPARVSWQSEARLRFAGKGIVPDAVPWMCEQVGLTVTAVKCLRIGRIAMGGLPPGQWRYLPPGERF